MGAVYDALVSSSSAQLELILENSQSSQNTGPILFDLWRWRQEVSPILNKRLLFLIIGYLLKVVRHCEDTLYVEFAIAFIYNLGDICSSFKETKSLHLLQCFGVTPVDLRSRKIQIRWQHLKISNTTESLATKLDAKTLLDKIKSIYSLGNPIPKALVGVLDACLSLSVRLDDELLSQLSDHCVLPLLSKITLQNLVDKSAAFEDLILLRTVGDTVLCWLLCGSPGSDPVPPKLLFKPSKRSVLKVFSSIRQLIELDTIDGSSSPPSVILNRLESWCS